MSRAAGIARPTGLRETVFRRIRVGFGVIGSAGSGRKAAFAEAIERRRCPAAERRQGTAGGVRGTAKRGAGDGGRGMVDV